MPRVTRAITGVLVCLLIFTPIVWASTAETWTSGIYDYESDDVVQVVAHNEVAAVHSNPILTLDGALVIVGRFVLRDRTSAVQVAPSPSRTRGPPLP